MRYHKAVLSVRRIVAALGVLLIVVGAAAPAIAACAGWSIAPGDRHACACCADLGELASTASITQCCAASEQSSGPVDRENQLQDSVRPVDALAYVPVGSSPEAGMVRPGDRIPLHAVSSPKYILLGSFLI